MLIGRAADFVNDDRWADKDSDGATYETGSEVTTVTAGEMCQPCKDMGHIVREREKENREVLRW